MHFHIELCAYLKRIPWKQNKNEHMNGFVWVHYEFVGKWIMCFIIKHRLWTHVHMKNVCTHYRYVFLLNIIVFCIRQDELQLCVYMNIIGDFAWITRDTYLTEFNNDAINTDMNIVRWENNRAHWQLSIWHLQSLFTVQRIWLFDDNVNDNIDHGINESYGSTRIQSFHVIKLIYTIWPIVVPSHHVSSLLRHRKENTYVYLSWLVGYESLLKITVNCSNSETMIRLMTYTFIFNSRFSCLTTFSRNRSKWDTTEISIAYVIMFVLFDVGIRLSWSGYLTRREM
jgi:hypothetical protein